MEGSQGLPGRRAAQLLEEYGENRLESARKTSPLAIFAGQFRDALVMILLGCTLLSCLMGDAAEALAIAVIVLLNALLGFFQEYRTERTLEKLGEPMPSPWILRLYRQLGGWRITLGSDAHQPERVGQGLAAAAALARELGFPGVCTCRGRQLVFHPF